MCLSWGTSSSHPLNLKAVAGVNPRKSTLTHETPQSMNKIYSCLSCFYQFETSLLSCPFIFVLDFVFLFSSDKLYVLSCGQQMGASQPRTARGGRILTYSRPTLSISYSFKCRRHPHGGEKQRERERGWGREGESKEAGKEGWWNHGKPLLSTQGMRGGRRVQLRYP